MLVEWLWLLQVESANIWSRIYYTGYLVQQSYIFVVVCSCSEISDSKSLNEINVCIDLFTCLASPFLVLLCSLQARVNRGLGRLSPPNLQPDTLISDFWLHMNDIELHIDELAVDANATIACTYLIHEYQSVQIVMIPSNFRKSNPHVRLFLHASDTVIDFYHDDN